MQEYQLVGHTPAPSCKYERGLQGKSSHIRIDTQGQAPATRWHTISIVPF